MIFENDIADVTGMSFPLVEIGKEDRVVCIFREGWRFALFFDFTPKGDLSIPDMQRDLGTLHRRLAYHILYDAIADHAVFSRIVAAGWFPFVEILGAEFRSLASSCEAGFELDDEESRFSQSSTRACRADVRPLDGKIAFCGQGTAVALGVGNRSLKKMPCLCSRSP